MPDPKSKPRWRVAKVRKQPKKDWKDCISSDSIMIKVGEDQGAKTFHISADLLTRRSPFFRAALNKSWKEGKEGMLSLPEDDAHTFEIFVHFLIFSSISTVEAGAKDGSLKELESLTECWVLGDKFQTTDFKDAVMDALCELLKSCDWVVRSYDVRYAYANTAQGSALRTMMVESAVRYWTRDDLKSKEEWPQDFLLDFCVRSQTPLEKRRFEEQTDADEDPIELAGCHFHEHAPGKKNCYDQSRK